MTTFSSVACSEVHGSVSENYSWTDVSASVKLQVAWSLRGALIDDIFLNMRPYPYQTMLYPKSASVSPIPAKYTSSDQGLDYDDYAIVTVKYGIPKGGEDQPEDPVNMVSETLSPTNSFQTLNPLDFAWMDVAGDPVLKPGEEPGVYQYNLTLERTHYNVSTIPDTVLTLPGCVNDTAYTSNLLGLTFLAETLLFGPPTMSRTIFSDGTSGSWTLNLRFEYKEEGWNKFWQGLEQGWSRIGRRDRANGNVLGQYKPYSPESFAAWLY